MPGRFCTKFLTARAICTCGALCALSVRIAGVLPIPSPLLIRIRIYSAAILLLFPASNIFSLRKLGSYEVILFCRRLPWLVVLQARSVPWHKHCIISHTMQCDGQTY